MICSSVNLDFLIVRLLILRVGLYSNLDQFAGLRSASQRIAAAVWGVICLVAGVGLTVGLVASIF
jgi:hypothetical protein